MNTLSEKKMRTKFSVKKKSKNKTNLWHQFVFFYLFIYLFFCLFVWVFFTFVLGKPVSCILVYIEISLNQSKIMLA